MNKKNMKKAALAALLALSMPLLLIGCEKSNQTVDISEQTIEHFDSIDIKADNEDVTIVPSDRFGLEAKLPLSDTAPEWGVKDNKLTIIVGGKSSNTGISLNENYYIKVFVPEGSRFAEASFSLSNGSVYIPNADIQKLSVTSGNGDISLEAFKALSEASLNSNTGSIELAGANGDAYIAQAKIKTDVGDISVKNAAWGDLTLESSDGGIQIEGSSGHTIMKTNNASIEANIKASVSERSYSLSSANGTITVNGDELKSPAITPGVPNVEATTSNGDIEIVFSGD